MDNDDSDELDEVDHDVIPPRRSSPEGSDSEDEPPRRPPVHRPRTPAPDSEDELSEPVAGPSRPKPKLRAQRPNALARLKARREEDDSSGGDDSPGSSKTSKASTIFTRDGGARPAKSPDMTEDRPNPFNRANRPPLGKFRQAYFVFAGPYLLL